MRIGHAELRFGSSRLFISDEYPDFGAIGPETLGGSPVKLHSELEDADAFGHSWFIASSAEDVSPEEMQRRWDPEDAL